MRKGALIRAAEAEFATRLEEALHRLPAHPQDALRSAWKNSGKGLAATTAAIRAAGRIAQAPRDGLSLLIEQARETVLYAGVADVNGDAVVEKQARRMLGGLTTASRKRSANADADEVLRQAWQASLGTTHEARANDARRALRKAKYKERAALTTRQMKRIAEKKSGHAL